LSGPGASGAVLHRSMRLASGLVRSLGNGHWKNLVRGAATNAPPQEIWDPRMLNIVTLTGNTGSDADVRWIESIGVHVARVSIAVQRPTSQGQRGGADPVPPDWHVPYSKPPKPHTLACPTHTSNSRPASLPAPGFLHPAWAQRTLTRARRTCMHVGSA